VLQKNPMGKEFKEDDEFRVNLHFSSNLVKVKIPVITSKAQKTSESNDLQRRVDEDRKHIIDATIVKVMKTRRKMDYNSLIAETTKILMTKFQPDVQSIKTRIEHLIEREYMERDKEDRRVFNYLA
jgi:cullin 3